MIESRYNVAVVGQTGVGKSSLINYLFPAADAKTGIGKPVTSHGFHQYDFEMNHLPVSLFDSWGLEVGRHEEWMRQLDAELKKRGVEQPAQDWFHSVLYCIAASCARVQDCDIDIIRKFIEHKYQVCVVLTKADLLSSADEKKLTKAIKDRVPVEVIPVCSEKKRTRGGESKVFGKAEVQSRAVQDFFNCLIERLPIHCRSVMEKFASNKINWLAARVDDGIGFMASNQSDFRANMDRECEEIYMAIPEIGRREFEQTINLYGEFLACLEYPPVDLTFPGLTFDSRKPQREMPWWEATLMTVTAPAWLVPGFVYQSVWGKKSDAKTIRGELYSYEKKMIGGIDGIVAGITKSLQDAQNRAQQYVVPQPT